MLECERGHLIWDVSCCDLDSRRAVSNALVQFDLSYQGSSWRCIKFWLHTVGTGFTDVEEALDTTPRRV